MCLFLNLIFIKLLLQTVAIISVNCSEIFSCQICHTNVSSSNCAPDSFEKYSMNSKTKSIILKAPSETNSTEYIECPHSLFAGNIYNASNGILNQGKDIELFGIRFDLANLGLFTISGITENVIVRADVIVLTQPILITYKV